MTKRPHLPLPALWWLVIPFAAFLLFIVMRDNGTMERDYAYLVMLDDNGKNGKKIGCGDSLHEISRATPDANLSQTTFERDLGLLFSFYGQKPSKDTSKPYNSLYDSYLEVHHVIVKPRAVHILLNSSDGLKLKGTCEDARMEAQLQHTAERRNPYPEKKVRIFIDGKLIQDIVSTA